MDKEYYRLYYLINKETYKIHNAIYHDLHRDEGKECALENREKIANYYKKYNEKNKDRIRESRRKYYYKNRDTILLQKKEYWKKKKMNKIK